MKALICYYSGSGNTLLAARYVAKNVRNVEIDMFDIVRDGAPDLDSYGMVGFAAFADFWAPSDLILDFIDRLPSQADKPAFVFNTFGMVSGKTLKVLADRATAGGFRVVAGHSLHTPENYPPMMAKGLGNINAPSAKELGKLSDFVADLDRLALRLSRGEAVPAAAMKVGLISTIMPGYPRDKSKRVMGDKYVDETLCTECGICAAVCPNGAIELDPKPLFDMEKCSGCWACYNHCPIKAVYTRKLRGVHHYPKPNNQLREKLS